MLFLLMHINQSGSLLRSLDEALEFHRDPERAEQMAKYMKNRFSFLGLAQPLRKQLTKPFLQAAKLMEMDELLQLASLLWKKPEREYQYVAMELLYASRKKWNQATGHFFLSLITTKSWWDTVDFIASRLIGEYLRKTGDWSVMKEWINSDDIWQNRTAIIFQLNYKEQTDSRFLFTTISQLQSKKDFFIQKAIGWSLRQYYRVAPDEVEEFVENAGLTGLARREALKHAG